jgi:hypothetical protein
MACRGGKCLHPQAFQLSATLAIQHPQASHDTRPVEIGRGIV